MRKRFIACIAFFLIVSLSCDKSLTDKIRFTGVSLDWFNRRPVAFSMSILGQKASSHKMEAYHVGDIYSEEDGSFDKEFPAARSDEYYFYPSTNKESLHPKRMGNTFDFGEIYNPHRFVCRVRLIRNPGSIQSVKFMSGWIVPFDRSPDTVYFETQVLDRTTVYQLSYEVFSGSTQRTGISIAIGSSDTVSTTIRY